jgi:hypothetical protein
MPISRTLTLTTSLVVACRFLQGAGGATMVPVGRLVILRSVGKPASRAVAARAGKQGRKANLKAARESGHESAGHAALLVLLVFQHIIRGCRRSEPYNGIHG